MCGDQSTRRNPAWILNFRSNVPSELDPKQNLTAINPLAPGRFCQWTYPHRNARREDFCNSVVRWRSVQDEHLQKVFANRNIVSRPSVIWCQLELIAPLFHSRSSCVSSFMAGQFHEPTLLLHQAGGWSGGAVSRGPSCGSRKNPQSLARVRRPNIRISNLLELGPRFHPGSHPTPGHLKF